MRLYFCFYNHHYLYNYHLQCEIGILNLHEVINKHGKLLTVGLLDIRKFINHDFEMFSFRNHKIALQACVQPLHRAEYGDLQLS